MRLDPKLGRAILRGIKRTHRIPDRQKPPSAGDKLPLHYRHLKPSTDGLETFYTYTTGVLLHVTDVKLGRLADVNEPEAMLEGFDGIGEFQDWWREKHQAYVRDGRRVIPAFHFDGHCWVVHFDLEVPDQVRLLSEERGVVHDAYTQSPAKALVQEPEAIDPAIIEKLSSTREAKQRWTLDRTKREAFYYQLPLADKLRVLDELKAQGVDVSGPVREIHRQADRAIRRGFRKAA